MKGYLNDKEVKAGAVIEIYEDGTSDLDTDGSGHDVLIMLLDAVVAMTLHTRKNDVTNEDIAEYVKNFVLGSLNMYDKAQIAGVFNNDLC